MIIGRMNKRIILQEPVKTPDGRGGFTTVWTTRATVWSEFKKPTLSTEVIAGAVSSDMTREISVRWRTDVKKGWQVLFGARKFLVAHTFDYGREATMLVCREVVV